MIIMLGQGLLYHVHRERHLMLTKFEKRRVFLLM